MHPTGQQPVVECGGTAADDPVSARMPVNAHSFPFARGNLDAAAAVQTIQGSRLSLSVRPPFPVDPGMHTVDRAGVYVVGIQAGVGSDAGSVACRTLAASLSNETARCAR